MRLIDLHTVRLEIVQVPLAAVDEVVRRKPFADSGHPRNRIPVAIHGWHFCRDRDMLACSFAAGATGNVLMSDEQRADRLLYARVRQLESQSDPPLEPALMFRHERLEAWSGT